MRFGSDDVPLTTRSSPHERSPRWHQTRTPAWLLFRVLPPLAIGCAILTLRRGQPFMETFLSTVWIGFFVHAAGWFRLRRSIGADAAAYLLLLVFYSRVAEMAWAGLYRRDWIVTASVVYMIYAAATAMIWFDRHPARQEG